LAGALGKPVWLLNRFASEWRWMCGRDDTTWYPSMRLFTQDAAGWDGVIRHVAEALDREYGSLSGPLGLMKRLLSGR